jgi:hypothetical protein
MNYQILNYLGEEVNSSISQEELDLMKEDTQLNVFQWDASEESNILIGFAKQLNENPSLILDNVRIFKLIDE